ncbi:hypothetical protein [Roseateles chitinivorans]|uniref:hypothetical protein n=1 Tax=Roseateles chitinivorans TaxID=2917965 RepID=UPI003D67025F
MQARVAGWDLVHTGPQTVKALLCSFLGSAVRGTWVSDAAVANMVEGLLSGRMAAFQDAYLDLVRAGRDAQGGTDLRLASADFRALKAACLADAAFMIDDLQLDASAALAELFIDAVDADVTSGFKLDFQSLDRPSDLVGLAESDPRVREWRANAGVRLELLDVIERLHAAGVTGPLEWVSDSPVPGLTWRSDRQKFVAQSDLRHLIWSNYTFDTVGGLRLGTARTFASPVILDRTPLRALSVLDPDLRQILDRAAGTVRLEWMSHGASNATLLEILPSAGVPLDESLARLDIMVSALVTERGEAVLDGLPAHLTLAGDVLRNSNLVIARRVKDHWQFERSDAWNRPAPSVTMPAPMTGDGRAAVIGRQIEDAKSGWPAGLLLDDGIEKACVLAFEATYELPQRPIARTLMSAILTDSMPALLRAHRMLLDAAYAQNADVAVAQGLASADFERMIASARLRIEAHDDARRNVVVVDGLEQARFLAEALNSSAGDALRLRYDALRRAIESPATASLADRRHAALVLSMRDRLDLLSDSGVIGPVGYVRRRRPPAGQHPEEWRSSRDEGWISDKGFLKGQWSVAAFDPSDETVKSISFNDLIDKWDRFADLMEAKDHRNSARDSDSGDAHGQPGAGNMPSATQGDDLTLDDLRTWTEATIKELKAVRKAARGDRAVAMSEQSWQRRLDHAGELLRRASGGQNIELRTLSMQLVALTTESEQLASTAAFKALYGEGGLSIVDEKAPLSTLRQLRPGLSQAFDRGTGRPTLGVGADHVVWEVPRWRTPTMPGAGGDRISRCDSWMRAPWRAWTRPGISCRATCPRA